MFVLPECAMSESPGPLCDKSYSQLLPGLPEFLLLWHSPEPCVSCGCGWWPQFCCPLSSHSFLGLSIKLKSDQSLKGQCGGFCCEGLVPSSGGNS